MQDVTIIVAPESNQTRLLGTINEHEVLKAALPGLTRVNPHALPTLLEALARWTHTRLSVVLVVDESADSSFGDTYEALVETPTVYYDVGVAVRDRRRRVRQTIGGVASFRDLQVFRRRHTL